MHSDFNGPYVIEHGDVWYREGKPSMISTGLRHICGAHDEMAIAHDGQMLLKVGSAEAVSQWEVSTRAKYAAMNEMLSDMGNDPVEVTIVRIPVSPETVEEINACIAISGRVRHLEANLERIGVANPGLALRPTYLN
jgi:hypothetical protein